MSQQPQEPKRGDFAREEGEVILRKHEFDGIQEYDQKLPNWWLFTFYIAIVWFVVHWVLYYHTDIFKSPQQGVTQGLVAVNDAKQKELEKTLANLSDSVLVHNWAAQPDVVNAGEAIYTKHCTPCHGADMSATIVAGGNKIPLPGLSLVDNEWKYGAMPMDIFKLINDGTPPDSSGYNGARMQAWSQMLSPKEVAEVVSFLIAKVPEDFEGIPKP